MTLYTFTFGSTTTDSERWFSTLVKGTLTAANEAQAVHIASFPQIFSTCPGI